MQAHDFSQELAAFEKRKSELLDVCEGKFAVFKADQYLGIFDTYLAAYEA